MICSLVTVLDDVDEELELELDDRAAVGWDALDEDDDIIKSWHLFHTSARCEPRRPADVSMSKCSISCLSSGSEKVFQACCCTETFCAPYFSTRKRAKSVSESAKI